MKICLVGSFNLAHGYLGAARALEERGVDVNFIPAAFYKSEHPKNHVSLLLDELKKDDSDFILWWRAETLKEDELLYLKEKVNKKFIMYSWDDPFQWEVHKEMSGKCKALDIAFSCCMDSVSLYEKNGCKAVYCPPGYDPSVHKPSYDKKYESDISLVCTNLYHGRDLTKYPHLSRKTLCDWITEDSSLKSKFKIYGPEYFNIFYPDNYCGWIDFESSCKVFSSSKINICTHIRPDGNMYINERVCQILGSGGLLLVDSVNGIEKVLNPEKDCLLINGQNKDLFLNQIKDILNNYEKYEQVRENGLKKAEADLTWGNWAQIIINNLEEK